MSKQLTAIIYVRESTKDQDWESQLLECREYCKRKNLKIICEYMDQMSGARNDRKGFLELNDRIANKDFNVLVVWELSRTTRDFITYRALMQTMKEADIELHSLQEGILTNDEDVDRNFGIDIMALLNERERKIIGRRIKIRFKFFTENGLWKGGRLPFGYDCVDKILVPNSDAEKVKEIFNLFIEGETVPDIARKLGFSDYKRLYRIMSNPVYVGNLKLNEREVVNDKKLHNKNYQVVQGKHEAIISEETFNIVNDTIEKNRRYSHSDSYLFKNIYCFCGGKMYPNKQKTGKSVYTCIKCHTTLQSDLIENMIFKTLKSQLNEIQLLDEVNLNPNNPKVKLALLTKEINKINIQEEKLTSKYLEDKISSGIFDKLSKDLKIKKSNIEKEIEKNKKQVVAPVTTINNREIFEKYIKKLEKNPDIEKKKKILNLIISEVKMVNHFRGIIISNLLE